MTAPDIKDALQTLAQDAPDTASLRLQLGPRIRRRRRIRQTLWTATVICGVGAVTAGVLVGVSLSGPEPAGPSNPPDAAGGQVSFARFGACGSRIATQPDTSLPLQLTASLPTTPLRATGKPAFTQIDMSVRNLSDSAVQVTTSWNGARMAITKDGTVVASPGGERPVARTYTIEAGATRDYKSTLNLVSCDTNTGLAPGRYQLHALQIFTLNDKDLNTGPPILVPGGPWDIEVG
jgi:hypothetical protein